MQILVGSQALEYWWGDSIHRKPKDFDFFASEKIEGAETFYHPDLEKWDWSSIVATPDELYTIKVSHSFWDLKNGSWDKHMFDMDMLKQRGAQFIPELYEILYPIWEEVHGKKKANLNASPEDFFTDTVKREFEHDSIHETVTFYDEPLFKRILKDGHEVAVDVEKFRALPHDVKLDLVREEVCATALERWIIPRNYKFNRNTAYSRALKQTLTSFWKGEFALFIALNFGELRKPVVEYVHQHHRKIHLLKPLK